MRRRKGIVAIGLSLIMLGTSFSTSVLAVNTNVKQNESTNLINDGITFEEKISTSLIKDEGEYRQKSGEWGDENKEHKFTTDIERLKYKKGQSINIKIDNNDSDIKYRYELDNVELVKANGESDDIDIVAKNDGFGRVNIYGKYEDGQTEMTTVYTYAEGENVYISDISEDTAWNDCMQDKYDAGLISKHEWEDAYSEYSKSFYEEYTQGDEIATANEGIALLSVSDSTTIKGQLVWTLKDGTKLPLRNSKVNLMDKEVSGADYIATTYTDDNGYYSFTFDNPDEWYELEAGGLDVFIRWYPASTTFGVTKDFGVLQYYMDGSVTENVASGSTLTRSYIVNYNEALNPCKAFYLEQLMLIGQEYAIDMGMPTGNYINVIYPFGTAEMIQKLSTFLNKIYDVGDSLNGLVFSDTDAFCYGMLNGQCFSAIGKNVFNDVDTLIHEYGHFVEHTMGTYGIGIEEMVANSPKHYFVTDHFYDKNDKEFAMELTWSEAWASAFSQIAQEYFVKNNVSVSGYTNIPYIADAYEDNSYNFETVSVKDESCEAQEYAVAGFLWDIYDSSGTAETFDNVSLGYKNWWNHTTKKGIYTLQNFTEYIYGYSTTYKNLMGQILSEYQIAPGTPYTSGTSYTKTAIPTIRWKVNGSKYNPNNRFRVKFYDAYGNNIYTTSYINTTQNYNTYYSYAIPQSVWNQVIKNYGGTFTIYYEVEGYNTKEFVSGPYTTNKKSIKVTVNDTATLSASNRYTERVIKLDKGGCFDYTVTFATSGYKLIQTFGTKDTKIEVYSSSGTLLTSDDDGGYGTNALKYYYFTANTSYKIRVKFYSGSVYGVTKLAITPANGTYSSSSLSNYEGISAVTGKTSYSSQVYASKNCTKVMRFTPPTTGSYTLQLQSNYDTYMYVIDPRSSSELVSGNNFNDDSGTGLNPLITTNLTAGVQYLIIYSMYNPNSLTGEVGFGLVINKN